jgi:glycosyltransferase involved in cell wall biosynthesis
MLSTWGSDLYYYGQHAADADKIRATLAACDHVVPDCERDMALARSFGFGGSLHGPFLASGGLPMAEIRSQIAGEPLRRRVIAVKGYQGKFGRAVTALDAIDSLDELAGWQVVIYLPNDEVMARAAKMRKDIGVRPLAAAPNREIWRLLGTSRIAVALSVSDGIPVSLVEAMAAGAFPVQSNTGSTEEAISSGVNGMLVPADDVDAVAEAIVRAATDDELVTSAARINAERVEQWDLGGVRPRVLELYRQVTK